MTTYELKLPWTRIPLSLNYRMHHQVEARAKRQVHHDVIILAMHARLPRGADSADISLVQYPATRRRRDTDNPTPTLKAAIDALVKYGLVPDDDSLHVKSQCVIGEVRRPSELILRIEVA